MPPLEEIHWQGLGVSEGIVIGRVLRMHSGTRYVYRARIDEADIERELRRFRAAVRLGARQLQKIKERAEVQLGKDHAYIFDAHLLLLEDKKLIRDVEAYIVEERANAEWALKVVGDQLLSVYSEIKDEYLRERGSDIDDVVQRLLVALSGERPPHRNLSHDAVIVSQDLLPSAVAELDLNFARAIATDAGGWTSHTAIIARALGIPAVVGLRDFYRRARTGDSIIIDSSNNEVILNPSPATTEHYRHEADRLSQRGRTEALAERGPARTTDGIEIILRANVELPTEFAGVTRYGAMGIGLYRSEFLLSPRAGLITEDQQYAAYADVARVAGEAGAIVRLFDLGGERNPESWDGQQNPALGLRAIRFGLRQQEVMREQMRAILRAAAEGKLDIVLPMVTDVDDVRRARAILQEEEAGLQQRSVPFGRVRVGAMIEIPAAVLTADKIARVVDFFELGTNDLVQYTLAVDRGNDQVAEWFRTLHPAVLQEIEHSLRAAREAGIQAIVCGEMASTPAYAVLLVGFGATDLSMTPASIPRVRHALNNIDSNAAREICLDCLQCEAAEEVETLVRKRFLAKWPQVFSVRNLPASRKRQ